MACVCGVQARSVDAPDGRFCQQDLARNLQLASLLTTRTSLICLENTFDLTEAWQWHPHMPTRWRSLRMRTAFRFIWTGPCC